MAINMCMTGNEEFDHAFVEYCGTDAVYNAANMARWTFHKMEDK